MRQQGQVSPHWSDLTLASNILDGHLGTVARPAEDSRAISAAQMARLRNPFNVFQLDATAYPGNSGSPVYLPGSGKVIGVINSVYVKESRESVLEKPSGISYAIPVEHVKALLRGE